MDHASRGKNKKAVRVLPAAPEMFDRLTEIWEAAVRATHTFLPEEDIVFFRTRMRSVYLPQVGRLEVACDDSGVLAFMGITPPEGETPARVEMLFVDPACRGMGIGTALLRHAEAQFGALDLDVNEQNPGAVGFYMKFGFVVIGRSETDGQGKPYPLLLMRKSGACRPLEGDTVS